MSKVAIVGSCITRDLWPVRGDAATDLLYVSRTSLASLFARPVAGFRATEEPLPGLGRHQQLAVAEDLAKTALRRLVAFRPTHLILDLIDERFDLMNVGDTVFTRSWELETSGYLDGPAFSGARPIPRLSSACDRLWSNGAAQFMAYVAATPLAEARLILHSARWARASRSADGGLDPSGEIAALAGGAAYIDRHNDLLARYESQLAALAPLTIVAAADARVADKDHRWGFSPFHYVPEYYAQIWRQLADLGVSRAD